MEKTPNRLLIVDNKNGMGHDELSARVETRLDLWEVLLQMKRSTRNHVVKPAGFAGLGARKRAGSAPRRLDLGGHYRIATLVIELPSHRHGIGIVSSLTTTRDAFTRRALFALLRPKLAAL